MEASAGSMLVATVATIEGRPVQWYLGVVSGGAVANAGRSFGTGGDEPGCSRVARPIDLRDARDTAIVEMIREAAERGANAVIGVDVGYEPIGSSSEGMALIVTASGTAVRV